ncbi:unnamed protein product [Nesidiocoris tenuis]|uniref:Uncharacterized protein n=1 Tax=Nesidiocoris tenuis TaxID=355587 RepID=A0A6H5GWC6_9HEMI|nr:unnamed protein product [Nesidiocoris tenuis]CAB0007120.1 unnamed protein product [Nesidiocoris tenuis]CAB0020975.1 unnamed protein product [Nesidiocoris tenuis]
MFGSTVVQSWNAPRNKYILDKPRLENGVECQFTLEDIGRIKRLSLAELDVIRRMSISSGLGAGNVNKTIDVAIILRDCIAKEALQIIIGPSLGSQCAVPISNSRDKNGQKESDDDDCWTKDPAKGHVP